MPASQTGFNLGEKIKSEQERGGGDGGGLDNFYNCFRSREEREKSIMTIPCSWNPVEFSRRLFTDLHTHSVHKTQSEKRASLAD